MESVENSNLDPKSPPIGRQSNSPQVPVDFLLPSSMVQKLVKDETYFRIRSMGTKLFGERFAEAHENALSDCDRDVCVVHQAICVIHPDEFFFHAEALNNNKLTEEQERIRKEFQRAQNLLYIDFIRRNLELFSVDSVVSTIQSLKRDIDEDVLGQSLHPSSEVNK